jgi:polyhydroxyalkanoate synthesis repressor PhaR
MKKPAGDGTVIVKKYANRRLYNTETSSYITLDHLAAMTRAGRDFKVVDAKTDEDITHSVLTQIIMDEEGRGETMLPVNFLRQLIAMYGDSMGSMVPSYLEASMDSFRRNGAQFTSAMEGAFAGSPFADLAKRNLAMFEAAAQAFKAAPGMAGTPPSAPTAGSTPSKDDEIASLRAEIARLQETVERVAGATGSTPGA